MLSLREGRRVVFRESGFVIVVSEKARKRNGAGTKEGSRRHERFQNSFLGNYGKL